MPDEQELTVKIAEARIEDDDLVLKLQPTGETPAFVMRFVQSVRQDPKWLIGTVLALFVSAYFIPQFLQRESLRSQRVSADFAARREAADAVAAATAPLLAEIEFFVSPRTTNEGLDGDGLQRIYNNTERAWLASSALADAKISGLYEGRDDSGDLIVAWQDYAHALRRLHRLSSYSESEDTRTGWYGIVREFLDAYAQPRTDAAASEAAVTLAVGATERAWVVADPGECNADTLSVGDMVNVVEGRLVGTDGPRNDEFQDAMGSHLEVFSACRDRFVRELLSTPTMITELE